MKDGYVLIDSLSISSEFEEMPKVEGLIDKICAKLNVNEDFYGNVLIAVTEAVNNAIIHGNKSNEDLLVELAVGDKDLDFCFSISDDGEGFDFNNLPDPTSPENIEKENGRGIYLMKSLADEVVFEDEGRRVTIYFSKN